MAYIGRDTDKISNVEVLDNITFDGSSSYTLQKGGSNFTPSSANTILLSIDGVVQAGNFTVSGSTIDFGTAVAGTSTCDFILHYGVGLITTPSDGTVTAAKLNDDIISGQTALASEPADTDEFLVSDAGTLKRIDYSLIKGGGITEVDQWRLTTDFTGSSDLTSNLERNDTAGFGYLGTGMTESSGIFTFPSTGVWLITFNVNFKSTASIRQFQGNILTTTDNSSYTDAARSFSNTYDFSSEHHTSVEAKIIFDCTDTSTHKVKFNTAIDGGSSSVTTDGDSTNNYTYMTFIRLGDT